MSAMTKNLERRLESALSDKKAKDELKATLAAGPYAQAAHVATIGATTPLTAIAGTYADLAAARASVNTLRTDTEARLAAIEAKVDALITALHNAGLVA